MLACALRPAPSHLGFWSPRPSSCCTRTLAAAPCRGFPRQVPQSTPRRHTSPVHTSPEQAKGTASQGAHRYTYSRAVRLVTRADAGEPPAQLAGVLAPELCTPEAVRELMADAGPGGRLLLCRVYAWRCTWPEGYRGARRVAAVLELVNPLDGKLAPEWEGGLELAQEAEGWEWHQTLVPVLWSAERGIIQALPDAAGKPSGSGVFKPYRVGTTDREFLSWCVDSDGEGELWFDVTGYSEDGEDELELSEDLWNRVVVEDEGVPVRLALLVPHGKRT